RLFEEPFATPGGGTLLLRVRAGAASTSTSGATPAGVLRDANLALSAAQASDTERIRICDDALRREEERRLRLEYELSTPTITDQFRLAYQPLVDLSTGAVPCMEALLLWDHPELGEIGPGEFVPIAERNGAIVPIGAWVLRRACEQLAAWDEVGVDPGLQLAINVSARQLLDVDLVPTVAGVLDDTGLAPERLALEVTETVLADHSDVTTAKLQAMADVGVRIHIDDFGTGYSSFAQLGRFPFHGLKIDRSFVTPLGVEADADPVIAALLAIAAAQGLEVIAEGVDAEVQVAHLRALGCQLAQGYLWSKALSPEAVPAFLARPRPVPPPATIERPR
ncbi:MAG: EAL domain-containing protein, partial [Nitriliruptor sp.]